RKGRVCSPLARRGPIWHPTRSCPTTRGSGPRSSRRAAGRGAAASTTRTRSSPRCEPAGSPVAAPRLRERRRAGRSRAHGSAIATGSAASRDATWRIPAGDPRIDPLRYREDPHPMLEDRYDLPASTASTTALEAYVDGVDRLLSANAGAEDCFD